MSKVEAEEPEIRDGVSDQANSSDEEGEDVMDSSEEEDDDDDEDEAKKIREGFIVDDEEEAGSKRSKMSKKRKREKEKLKRGEDDALDEDDLELLRENTGARESKSKGKFKRLKKAQTEDDEDTEIRADNGPRSGLIDIFSDDEGRDQNERDEVDASQTTQRNILDEFEDFIEEDEYSDEEEARRQKAGELQRAKARKRGPKLDASKLSSVDRESLQQLFEVFGTGEEYDWALEAQEIEDDGNTESLEPKSLDEVFEYSELKERMLTEEDNLIRIIDTPERYQKYRQNLNYADLEGEELNNEKHWVASILCSEKKGALDDFLEPHFRNAVGDVVEFISKDNYEVPFIWTHRRDYLLFTRETQLEDGTISNTVHKLLFEDDLWRIVQLDIEYHSLYEKRVVTELLAEKLGIDDDLMKDIKSLDSMVAIQDLHDYIHFTYSAEIRDLKNHNFEEESNEDLSKIRKHSKFSLYEKIKSNVLYDGVKALGISAKELGDNIQDQSSKQFQVPYRIHATDDALEAPEDLVEKLAEDDGAYYKDEKSVRDAIRKTFSEEIIHNPKVRSEVRSTYKNFASISVALTEKGRATIDDHSVYADIKYAISRSPSDLIRNPDVLLRMLEAEDQGLLIVKVATKDYDSWFQCIFNCLKSDGTSEISDKWNRERELILQQALKRLTSMVALNTKEDLRRECQRLIAVEVRRRFSVRVDQAPYTPFGYDKGTKPNVLALSFGKGDFDSAVVGAFIKENGKIDELFKSENNPIKDRENEEKFAGQLKEFYDKSLQSVKPDVIVVSGFNANSKRLFESVKSFVEQNEIWVNTDDLTDISNPPLVQVIWGQDETARLYQNSERASAELSDKTSIVKYCVGLARYVQSPLLEYISLNDDIHSLSFHEHQKLIPRDLVSAAIETVFVDIVNMVGVEINEAVRDPYVSQLLPYIAGLGPRKASGLIRNINSKLGSNLPNRSDLIENELTTANIFINCAGFLNIAYDEGSNLNDPSVELLDATRIHPEDYDLAQKMAADALDLDEEDMAHIEEQGGIIYQLMQDGVNKVDDLNLTAYGKELENKFGKKKYATLQSIKEELVNNFEELRRSFHLLSDLEVFQMLTGENTKSFARNTLVPITVSKVVRNLRDPASGIRFVKGTTTSLIQGTVEESFIPPGLDLQQGQVVPVVVLEAYYDTFTATFSLLEQDIKKASAPQFFKDPSKWDFNAENEARKKEVAKEKAQQSRTRNIQHPLFFNFNHKQAEEFLAPQSLGDCIIRPSSRGPNYLTVTWKVSNNLFQHLLVVEDSSGLGKEYVVDNKRYTDLDQLIFQHVQAIAKRVDEMVRHPKFREGTISEVNEWLESYTKANPKNSAYVFCFDHKAPGSFLLLFKVNVNTPISTWHVRTEVDGYTLKGFSYPSMLRLCNGFKQTFKSYVSSTARSRASNDSARTTNYNGYGY